MNTPGGLLEEQIAYYRARAQEYDETILQTGRCSGNAAEASPAVRELTDLIARVGSSGPYERVLELAAGTGIWTEHLARVARHFTAVDASPEMIGINRRKVGDPTVEYVCADLFNWQPEGEYDLVFFAFWLSHVPPERVDDFLSRMAQAVRPGGTMMIVDEPAGTNFVPRNATDGIQQRRELIDGRQFHIVKVYYEPNDLVAKLNTLGFEPVEATRGSFLFALNVIKKP